MASSRTVAECVSRTRLCRAVRRIPSSRGPQKKSSKCADRGVGAGGWGEQTCQHDQRRRKATVMSTAIWPPCWRWLMCWGASQVFGRHEQRLGPSNRAHKGPHVAPAACTIAPTCICRQRMSWSTRSVGACRRCMLSEHARCWQNVRVSA